MEQSNPPAVSSLREGGWIERTVPPELSKQHGQLPGKLKGILGMPGLTSQMEAIHSKVQSLLSTHQQANEQGSIDQAQLDEWRDAVTKWPISNLQHPLSFNRPASWAPPGLVAKSRPSTTPEQSPKTEERAAAPITPPNPSSQPVAPGKDVSAVPRVDTKAIKVAWGATEGGRDHLGWVRHLICFTETHPLFVPSSAHALPGVTSRAHNPEVVIGTNGERGVKEQVFPAAHPSKREDVRLLAHWLTETLQHLDGNLPYGEAAKYAEAAAGGDGEALANGALWVYSIAFDEFRRALATESRDRAEILAAMWDHCFALVQARTALSYEGVVDAARHEVAARVDAAAKAEQAAADRMKGIIQDRDELRIEADRKEATLKAFSQRLIKAERVAERSIKEKKLIEDSLKGELSLRLEAEAEVFRSTRRAEASAAAASTVMQKIAVLESKKAEVVHCSVQQVMETQDVQVDVDLMTREVEKAAAAEAKAKSALEEMKRDLDTNTVIMMSLQEQLKERDSQLYQMQARIETSEERSISFENLAAELKAELAAERATLEATATDLTETRQELAQVSAELTALHKESSSATHDAADALAHAEMRFQAADVARLDAQEKSAAAIELAEAAQKAMVELREQLQDAKFELQSLCELAQTQLQCLIKSECSAAYTVETEGAAWQEYGTDTPMSVVMSLANGHLETPHGSTAECLQATYLRYVDSADHARTLTSQLHDASLHRAELETALQDAKLERARAVRDKEEASIATSEVADVAEGLKLELEQRKKEEEDHLAVIAALEVETKVLDEEITRLQTFVHKTQVMEVEADSLKVKIEMLEERAKALAERGDAATERAQQLQTQSKELSEKLVASEDLRQEMDAYIEELRLIKQSKELLQEAFDKVSSHASRMQQQYKKVSVQLVQAQMTIKNFGEMEAADDTLIAHATSLNSGSHSDNASAPLARHTSGPPSEASGHSHGTHSSAPVPGSLSSISEFPPGPGPLGGSHPTSANPGTAPTTNSIAELSRTDPSAPGAPRSEAGSTSSSVASYLPRRAGRKAAGGTEGHAAEGGLQSSAMQVSAQLASSQLKARLQQQRADAAESRERLLQRRLAEMEAASAMGDKPTGATDSRVDVLKEQVNKLEKHVANTAAELAAQQDRADALTAHIARGPAQAGGTQPASSEAGVGGVGGATTSVQQYEPTLAPIPGSPSVPVHAQQGLTGTTEGETENTESPRQNALSSDQDITTEVQQSGGRQVLRRTVSMVDDRDPDDLMMDINTEISHRVAASMRLKLGLLSWFCHNMRRRCVMEVVARLQVEQQAKAVEVELLEQASEREQQLLKVITTLHGEAIEWKQAMMQLILSFQPELKEATNALMELKPHVAVLQRIAHDANKRWLSRVDKFTQSTHASVDAWMDLVRGLPEDPPLDELMSHSALKATIIRIYDLRMSDIMKAPNPQELVSRDSVFDSIANYFNQQFAGDGEEVYMPELMEIDGPVARLLMSCRQYLKDPQVKLFAMFTGVVPEDYLGHEPWQFLLKVIFCVRLLMDVNWKLMIKAWPTDRGAPLPAAAIMDLLANLYNAENPTELNITRTQVAVLIKQSRIGPAVDLDVLLLAIIHDHMKGECPREAWVFPRRITDGRLPAINNVGGAALSSSGMSATGQVGSSRSGSSSSRPASRVSRPPSRMSMLPNEAPSQHSLRGQIDVYSVLADLNDQSRSNTPTTPPHNLPGTPP